VNSSEYIAALKGPGPAMVSRIQELLQVLSLFDANRPLGSYSGG
jgi:hypothetical protein